MEEWDLGNFVTVLDNFNESLAARSQILEAEALRRAKYHVLESKTLGGLDLDVWRPLDQSARDAVLFWVEAWLRSLTSAEQARRLRLPNPRRMFQKRGMTLTEKILSHHSIGRISPKGVQGGNFVRISVDWVVASEISYFVGAPFYHSGLIYIFA